MCDEKKGGCTCAHQTGLLAEAIRNALIPEGVLGVQTQAIPAGLAVEFDWHVPFSAVAVNIVGTGTLVIAAGTTGAGAPASGPGVAALPANRGGVFNLRGHSLTVYGTNAGDLVTVQAFTKPQAPGWG